MIEYVLRTDLGRGVGSIVEEPGLQSHIPALCDIELCAGLRRMIHADDLDAQRAASGVAIYVNLPLTRHPHQRLMVRILELRENFSAYDAAYVSLCERLGATLVTCDAKLTRAVRDFLPMNVIGVGG